MIKLDRIVKKIDNKTVLDNVGFTVKDGEILGLVGPNGAGKTTLLNIIAGVWRQDGGTVEMDGLQRDKLGYVPDTPYLYPKLTGREFFSFVADLYRLDQASLKPRIDEIEKVFDLAPWLDSLMESYPRGVRQKMVIGSVLLHSPSVFLLDEPLTNLDPKSSKLVKELLQKMAGQGAAVLFSTQILEIAEKICHRVVVLDNGRKIAEGSVAELRELTRTPSNNLEDIFLRLTGGEKYADLLAGLT
ncbi:MAG TPA: ABC transporter ATP-binding protein [Candidatus Sulfotelmatobacter sp.]|nr:ABC transporter ATP-binding protein [Candidatus Sulfotelmatobacter sp.]